MNMLKIVFWLVVITIIYLAFVAAGRMENILVTFYSDIMPIATIILLVVCVLYEVISKHNRRLYKSEWFDTLGVWIKGFVLLWDFFVVVYLMAAALALPVC